MKSLIVERVFLALLISLLFLMNDVVLARENQHVSGCFDFLPQAQKRTFTIDYNAILNGSGDWGVYLHMSDDLKESDINYSQYVKKFELLANCFENIVANKRIRSVTHTFAFGVGSRAIGFDPDHDPSKSSVEQYYKETIRRFDNEGRSKIGQCLRILDGLNLHEIEVVFEHDVNYMVNHKKINFFKYPQNPSQKDDFIKFGICVYSAYGLRMSQIPQIIETTLISNE